MKYNIYKHKKYIIFSLILIFLNITTILYFGLPRIQLNLEEIYMGRLGAWKDFSFQYFQKIKDVTSKELLAPLLMPYSMKILKKVPNGEFWYPTALNALGLEWAHRQFMKEEDLAGLRKYYAWCIATPSAFDEKIIYLGHAMNGYCLIYLEQITHNSEYLNVINNIYSFLLSQPKIQTGVIPYRKNHNFALVDTIGMICPFLARYGKTYDKPEAIKIAEKQLIDFIKRGTDSDTGLPFHGYLPGKKGRLGILGWGRGTGWYLMGIVDALEYIPLRNQSRPLIITALNKVINTLEEYQLENGAFSWAITNPYGNEDSSATAMLAYAIERAINLKLIDRHYKSLVDKALKFLINHTTSNGFLMEALADCSGVGVYPQIYGHRLWAQGPATALSALVLTR